MSRADCGQALYRAGLQPPGGGCVDDHFPSGLLNGLIQAGEILPGGQRAVLRSESRAAFRRAASQRAAWVAGSYAVV